MAKANAEIAALPVGARVRHETGASGIVLRYPDDATNFIEVYNLATGRVRPWRNGEYSADPAPIPAVGAPISPVFVVNAGIGVKISSIMWGVLAANLVTAIAVSVLYAATR